MQVFASILADTGVGARPDVQALGFDLDGDLWTFDPRRQGTMLVHDAVGSPALILRCRPLFLFRLLTQGGMTFEEVDELRLVGDPNALQPFIAVLKGGRSLWSLMTKDAKT